MVILAGDDRSSPVGSTHYKLPSIETQLPHGAEREKLIRKARQAETAAHIDEWLASPGLRVPR
jgi:hypothetical protein